ncbi:Las1-domain-containing protein [Pluteus cervinus]|uniref:Las1-domain-containing protein n=1 Tax=Pluteus cervinus TaxID=181527 RepID=A0ACD3BF54_9AGAR|nr:Las1-domain-containing protein [Pluteus cervinus]
MKLPRRVPWVSIAELDQVCSWIYADEHDTPSKILAINRLSAWRVITSLPPAVESTLSLLTVIFEDQRNPNPPSYLFVRQSYASALIRLVNGLVDSLQLGAYARSISSIAQQIGLPQWLVDLRHAATHEDLPSLELLREGARQSMTWLLDNYFNPTINPVTSIISQQTHQPPLRPFKPVLKQYTSLLKIVTRDASLKKKHAGDITSVLRDIERWMSEARVAANHEWGDQDPKEHWALDRFCDSLMEKGALVPLAKKKRIFSEEGFSPPQSSVEIWTPLLRHITSLHPDFPQVLITHICVFLTTPNQADASFDACLARWAMWCIEKLCESEEGDSEERREAISMLFHVLGPTRPTIGEAGESKERNTKAAHILLSNLCVGNEDFERAYTMLSQLSIRRASNEWTSDDLKTMSDRLERLFSLTNNASGVRSTSAPLEESMAVDETDGSSQNLPPGWKRLTPHNSDWKPCPIGVHCPS